MAATTIKNSEAAGSNDIYVVGIGASAGGLEAINELFDNLAGNTNFSFVIIQHLSPDYKSLMTELLSKHTSMKVKEAEHNTLLAPNCVYLLPPRKTMQIKHGRVKLEDKVKSNVPNNAIDIFLESLAIDKKEKAIAIILSGTGTDGTKGIAHIKEHGGTIVVQDPLTAEFDGMPNSAVATGHADLILPPEIMADELIDYLKETPFSKAFNSLSRQEEAILADIMELIQKTTGHDFSHYKRPTINRRLTKRMAELSYASLGEYYNFLKRDPAEATRLSNEFLINVTKFFRDEEAFQSLERSVIPRLVSDTKRTDKLIKVWVVGCSSGEEAYSIAMLFHEQLHHRQQYEMEVKIFATDIHQESIDIASKGLYPVSAMSGVSEERRNRFFTMEGDAGRITPSIRKMVVFAKQDILKDPPFSKIDLLVCRNMLIYMNPLPQKNVLKKFHFALNVDGFLFMGPSENIGALKDVMTEIDKKWKIYQCTARPRPGDHDTFLNPVERPSAHSHTIHKKTRNALTNIADIFKDTLLEEHNFAGFYIDKEFDIKQAVGNFKNFIDFPEGNFNFNLLKLLPTDLSIVIGTGIRKAIADNQKVILRKVHVLTNEHDRYVNVIIKPYLTQQVYAQSFIFIIMNEIPVEQRLIQTARQEDTGEFLTERLTEMEEELRNTRENLQAVIEEVESANEELQSSNEEIISSNEELQSTNEELQSLNEELHTVNAEHQLKIKELIELNDDMNNYFRNTEVGQILVDSNLIIKKFSPVTKRQINLIESDIGRSLSDISTNFISPHFISDIRKVLQTGTPSEKEIRVESNDTIYLMRIAPYLRQDKGIDGVVISFVNVTESRRLNSLVEAIFNASTSAITGLRPVWNSENKVEDFEFITANQTTRDILGISAEEIIGKRWNQDFNGLLTEYFPELLRTLETGEVVKFDYFNETRNRWTEVSSVQMLDGLVATFSNITQAKESYRELQNTTAKLNEMNTRLERSNLDLLQFASVASHDLKEPLRKIQTFGSLLNEKLTGKIDSKDATYLEKIIRAANRMQVLIQDILRLSKLSNADIPYTQVKLEEIVTNIVDDLYVSIHEKNVTVKTEHLPVIEAIPGQIHQLFQNLISNSIKFNDNEHPLITIVGKDVCDDDAKLFNIKPEEHVCIELSDNGIGFDEKYKEKIFGIFQRLSGSEYEGTGIGLAICKKIVDNHDGYIKAESRPGEGARFTVFLPIRKSQEPQQQEA